MNELKLVEIIPIEYDKSKKVIHMYSTIDTSDLTAKRLRDLYVNLNFKSSPAVSPLIDGFLITFYPKPPIFICSKDGRMYSFLGKWDLKEVQHQASLVMRVLSHFDLVKDHKRISRRRRK